MKKLLSLIIGLIAAIPCFAQNQTHINEAGFQSDNDSYLAQGSDRYYTNGIFLYFRHALKINDRDTAKLKNKVLGFEAGQKMYNPQSAQIPSVKYLDRPFAGYLYIGSTLNFLYSNESNLKLGAQLGIVGPDALGREAQETIHRWFGFYPPEGWQYQVRDGAELNLSAEYNRLLTRGKGVDLSFNSYGNLGNGFSGAGAGLMLRLGNFNQLFNSVSTQSTASRIDDSKLLHKHELFFYYKPALNYIAYDATVQGSLFKAHDDNTMQVTLDREPFMFSNQLGVAYTAKRWVLDASATFHSKDVKEMVKVHQWGSITALYRFN
jgi:lipid A 3-O-deacylase